MQIRCQQCHRPYALKKEQIHAALDQMADDDLNHYNVSCPHCRKMKRVTRKELMRFAPEWKKAEPANS